jgi:predicted RNA-binding Zn-ribbon protein involved in translation (DUF1610 family)
MTRMIVTYTPVKWSATKQFVCVVCGKVGRRSKTFRQTLNPYNKNAAGQPKTTAEIRAELQVEAQRWRPDRHAKCS